MYTPVFVGRHVNTLTIELTGAEDSSRGTQSTPTQPGRSLGNRPRRPPAEPEPGESFDDLIMPHLDAARRLARWLMRNEHDAEDVVQDALMRAFRYFGTFTGGNARAWFLRIVRNSCSGWRGHRMRSATDPFDEEQHSRTRYACDPEMLMLRTDDAALIERAMNRLPERSRDLLALRELEGLSYRELADAMDIPMGTVMSGLSRARQALRGAVDHELKQHDTPERTHRRERRADEVVA